MAGVPETLRRAALKVFVSSTFRDMDAERDHLASVVFPELEERLRARRRTLVPLDLRWGITTSGVASDEEKELHVLQVCLGEIERSRPFFIGLLGDRYGWAPPPDRMQRALAEAAVELDADGKSITAVEIDVGVLQSPDERVRAHFYLRAPLPYDEMPAAAAAVYSDAHRSDPDATGSVERLRELKEQIQRTVPDRTRRYEVRWNVAKQRVDGLDAFGQMVLEDLWSDIVDELDTLDAAEASLGARDPERESFLALIADHLGRFEGRRELVGSICDSLIGPRPDGTDSSFLVTGEAGSGKSGLFAAVYEAVEAATPPNGRLVLAHSAAASPAATSVDQMLRRFIRTLDEAGGGRLAERVSGGDRDLTDEWEALLTEVGAQREIVVMVDALDQFEDTPLARRVAWLPSPLPPNVSFFGTARSDTPVHRAVLERPDSSVTELSEVSAVEARSIILSAAGRYGRSLPEDVVAVLCAAPRSPLWLHVAVEDLLLMDADDYVRLGTFEGPPDRQLEALLLSIARAYPPDTIGLYQESLARVEATHGAAPTSVLLSLLALSPGGVRDEDLRVLVPGITGETLDGLALARVRRSLRAHLADRGVDGGWVLAHAQALEAARRRYLMDPNRAAWLHQAFAAHLLELPRDDPLRVADVLHHLVWAGRPVEVARYLGDKDFDGAERERALDYLVGRISADPETWGPWVMRLDDQLADVVDSSWYELASRDPWRAGRTRYFLFGDLLPRVRFRIPNLDYTALKQRAADAYDAAGGTRWATQANRAGLRVASLDASIEVAEARVQSGDHQSGVRDLEAIVTELRAIGVEFGVGYAVGLIMARALASLATGLEQLGRHPDADRASVEAESILIGLDGYRGEADASLFGRHRLRRRLSPDLAADFAGQRTLLLDQIRLQRATWAHLGYRPETSGGVNLPVDDFRGRPGETQVLLLQGLDRRDGGDLDGALESLTAALAVARDRRTAAPDDPAAREDVIRVLLNLGITHRLRAEHGHARACLAEAEAGFRSMRPAFIDSWPFTKNLSVCMLNLALLDPDSSEAQERLEEVIALVAPWTEGEQALPDALDQAWSAAVKRSDWAEAHADVDERVRLAERYVALTRRSAERAGEDEVGEGEDGLLSRALDRLGQVLTDAGQLARAEAAFEQALAVDLERREKRPEDSAVVEDLITSHRRLGRLRRDTGRIDAALASYLAAGSLLEALVATGPNNADLNGSLSVVLDQIGSLQAEAGDDEAALATYEAALEVDRRRYQLEPGSRQVAVDLAISHTKLGELRARTGELEAALASHRTALAFREHLDERDPEDSENRGALAYTQTVIGDLLRALGDPSGAIAAHEAARSLRLELLRDASDPVAAEEDVAVSIRRIAVLERECGNLERAARSYEAELLIRRQQYRRAPDDGDVAMALSTVYDQLGDLRVEAGDLDAAGTAYEAALAVDERRYAQEPANTQAAVYLAISHTKLSDVHRRTGDLAAALVARRAAALLREGLHQRDPADSNVSSALGQDHTIVGDLEEQLDDLGSALAAHQTALEVRLARLGREPESFPAADDVAISHTRIGRIHRHRGDTAAARTSYEAALAVRHDLCRRDPDEAYFADQLRSVETELEGLG